MKTFTIQNKEYKIKNLYGDWTLKDAVKVVELDVLEADIIELLEMIEEIEYPEKHLKYITEVLAIVTNIPREILDVVDPVHKGVLWLTVREIVGSLYFLNLENYTPVYVEKVTFKGKTYYTPESLTVDNREIFLYKEPAKNVVEASNLMGTISDLGAKGIRHLSYLTATLLKPEQGAIEDEKEVVKRAEIFLELPLDVHFSLFFYLYCSFNNYIISSRTFLENQVRKRKRRQRRTLTGFLRWLRAASTGLWQRLRSFLSGVYARF